MFSKLGLRQKAGLELFRLLKKDIISEHKLKLLFWECTLNCNLNCSHCGSDCSSGNKTRDMPLEDFLKVLDDIKKVYGPDDTLIAVTGGEPLMRKDIIGCFESISARGFRLGLVSNGYFLDEALLEELINSGLSSLTVSLDGLEQSHNNFRNNKECYARALNAISISAARPDIGFDVVTCVHNDNINELEAVKKLLIENKVRRWRLFTVFPKGRAKNDLNRFILSNNNFQNVLEFIRTVKKEKKIECNFGCDEFLGMYEGVSRNSLFYCSAGINTGGILSDGSITACLSMRDEFVQGSIYKDSFTEVWETKYNDMRKRTWTKTGICNECAAYRYCEGNGLHLWNNGKLSNCYYHNMAE